jgi:GTP cyclohydrolase I
MTPTVTTLSMSEAIRHFLSAAGVDLDDPHLCETPTRVAKAYREELLRGYHVVLEDLFKTFEEPCESLVIVRDIPFYSLCAHHMLPFYGTATVAYRPQGRVVGLSKLARVVDCFAQRLQVQERLTREVAEAIQTHLNPYGAIVAMQAEHMCMSMRGVRKPGSTTITHAATGEFARDEAACERVLQRMLTKS